MKQKKIAFILLLISIISVCTGQILRPSISELVTKVSALEVLNCSLYDLKSKNPRCDDVEILCKEANDSELVVLTNNNSPIVRCYAFQCLVERRNSVWFTILKSHLTDTSSVIIMFSDLVNFK
ncbi:MAG TPA: hypothetical protein VK835_11430, partial [Bacteroidia bacterium]|nr:hypothetical protein [Bacteroidia bacterium]